MKTPITVNRSSKYSVSQIVGFIRVKVLSILQENVLGARKILQGSIFWARGNHVSTVGRDEHTIRKYTKEQEK